MNKRIFFAVLICVILVVLYSANNGETCFSQIVRDMGYFPEDEIYEAVEFTIPEKFNDVYLKYNALLKTGGFDLEPYKGKRCVRYTYLIPEKNARANIIVYDGRVIGGDISGITLDGIMIPLEKS